MKGRGKVTSLVRSVISAAALLLPGCGTMGDIDSSSGGSVCGTEVPDPTDLVVGCLVDESDRPAAGIIVQASTKHSLAKSGGGGDSIEVHTDTTDALGRYSFSSLNHAAYLITARDDSLRSMSPRRVEAVPGGFTRLWKDTLHRNGMVSGRLFAQTTQNPLPWVVCEVPDMDFVAKTDESGRFNMILPPGSYTLECGSNHNALVPTRTLFEVKSGETTPVSLSLFSRDDVEVRPQAPDTAYAAYDAVTGIVRLSWPPVSAHPAGLLYTVRRIDTANGRNEDKTFFTPDTFYLDVISWPRGEDGRVQAESRSIRYNVGSTFASTYSLSLNPVKIYVPVEPPRFLGPEAAVKAEGEKTGFQVGDTARVIGAWRNLFRAGHRLAWTLDATGAELKPSRNLADSAGADTLLYPCDSVGTHAIRFKVTDLSGAAASALQVIEVKPAP